MRDIRGDLQDRASFLEEQISAAQTQFEKRLDLLKREHQSRIEDLQSELEAVTTLIEGEYRRLTSAPVQDERSRPAPQAEAEPQRRSEPEPEHRRPAAEPEQYPRPPVAETEPQHRPAPEPERYHRPPMAEAEPQRRPVAEPQQHRQPEPEAYRRQAPEAEYQRRPAPEQEPYRGQPAPEAEPRRRPVPMPVRDEAEPEHRPAAPQVYRRAPEPEQRRPVAQSSPQPQQAQQPPLADFLIRKLSEIGAMTPDDLCHLAVQEGYFADGDNVERAVHGTLMNVAKAGFIRQLPNGTFAPATVMDTIRLRRAI